MFYIILVIDKTWYEEGKQVLQLLKSQAGLEKWFFSIHSSIFVKVTHPDISVILWGSSKMISEANTALYYNGLGVLFHLKYWCVHSVPMELVNISCKNHYDEHHMKEGIRR